MPLFKKKNGLVAKLHDYSSTRLSSSSLIKQAATSFKNDYKRTNKRPLISRILQKEETHIQKITNHAKALSRATKDTYLKHGSKVSEAVRHDSSLTAVKAVKNTKSRYKKAIERTAVPFNAILGTEVARSADSFLKDTLSSTSDIYDKAMDSARFESGHLGGDHRLFDGGHTLTAAWDRVKNAVPDDGFIDELTGYVRAIKNDVITPEGLPLKTLDKDSFNQFVEQTGVSAEWARDVATFTGTELLGAGVASLSLVFNWNEKEREGFAKFIGGTAIAATASANPLLGFLSLSAAAVAYQQRQNKTEFAKDVVKGAIPTAAFISTSGVVGGPVAVGLVAGTATALLSSKILNRDSSVNVEEFTTERIANLAWEGKK